MSTKSKYQGPDNHNILVKSYILGDTGTLLIRDVKVAEDEGSVDAKADSHIISQVATLSKGSKVFLLDVNPEVNTP